MSRYFSYFETESDYNDFQNPANGFGPKPNISLVATRYNRTLKFNPKPTVQCTFRPTANNKLAISNTSNILLLIVDGEEVTNFGNTYSFTDEEVHKVKIVLNADGVVSENMFKDSCITKLSINGTVKQIGNNAFNNCQNLTSISCWSKTAPVITSNSFQGIARSGRLRHTLNVDFSSWMQTGEYYLGYYNWTDSAGTK